MTTKDKPCERIHLVEALLSPIVFIILLFITVVIAITQTIDLCGLWLRGEPVFDYPADEFYDHKWRFNPKKMEQMRRKGDDGR